MVLVETYDSETEGDFRAGVEDLLTSVPVPPRRDWWRPYEVRGLYEWRGIRFREFFCIAGSVSMWLWTLAKHGGQRRVVLLPSDGLIMFVEPEMIGRGQVVPVSAADVAPVREAV